VTHGSDPALDEATWVGRHHYRGLSYRFSVQATTHSALEAVHAALSPLEVVPRPRQAPVAPDPGGAYAMVDTGTEGDDRFLTFVGRHRIAAWKTEAELVDYVLWHVNRSVGERSHDFLLVHAGAVVAPSGHGVLLPASSGSGKSTLVTALVAAGFGYLSDELGAIDPVTRRLYGYPRALTLKETSLPLFPELGISVSPGEHISVHLNPDDWRPGSIADPSAIDLVVLPSYVAGAPTSVTLLTEGETVVEVASHCFNAEVYESRALTLLSDMARRAPGYKLVSGSLSEAVEAVCSLTAGIAAASV
jgi:hypothetical protein